MQRAIVSLVFAAVALSFPPAAGAFCRTTTAPIPAGYDPTVEGCITQGTPLAWASMPVTYELNQAASTQVSLDEATPIFDAAFAAWAEASCPTTGPDGGDSHPALSFERLAPTDAVFVPCAADAEACEDAQSVGPHQIVFRDDAWTYDDSENAIALTTVTFGVDDGHVRSANMEINSHDFVLSTAATPPPGEISLAAIAKHEAGHFIGLAHAQTQDAVMYAFYQPGAIALMPDDIAGVCTVYPPASPSGGCACSTDGRAGGPMPWGMAAIAFAFAAARRRSRRPTEGSGRP
jgi:MYXO-CTERM domain-containing protein